MKLIEYFNPVVSLTLIVIKDGSHNHYLPVGMIIIGPEGVGGNGRKVDLVGPTE